MVTNHLQKPPLVSLSSSFRILLGYTFPHFNNTTSLKTSHHTSTRIRSSSFCQMGHSQKTISNFRLCNVSGRRTELVEIHATNPRFHILFIPGNPGSYRFTSPRVQAHSKM
nr:lipid droplet-associated hydrolase isoform X1 [Tanacetum cinerariifolium]